MWIKTFWPSVMLLRHRLEKEVCKESYLTAVMCSALVNKWRRTVTNTFCPDQHLRRKTISPRAVDLACSSYRRPAGCQVFAETQRLHVCDLQGKWAGRFCSSKLPMALFCIRKTTLLIPEHFLCQGMLQHSSQNPHPHPHPPLWLWHGINMGGPVLES